MRGYTRFIVPVCLIVLAIWSCKKPYNPTVISSSQSYLVVEGLINTGTDSTFIKLSRTVKLSSSTGSLVENGATVTIESQQGSTYTLVAEGNGMYVAPPLGLSPTGSYRLRISSTDGNTYVSDYVTANAAPPVDSLSFVIKSNGIQVNVNTHAAATATRYYRWSYDETWVFHSAYPSFYIHKKLPKDTIVARAIADFINECWGKDTASSIVLGSSAKLTQNVISAQPLTFIPENSEKIGDLYSIQVTQYAISADAFNYYTLLQKNTESLGTIFDAQPSELTGNVHCTNNTSVIAIGYITAGTSTKSRIFIDSRKLPAWMADNPYSGCRLDTDLYKQIPPGGNQPVNNVAALLYPEIELPVSAITNTSGIVLGFTASSPFCVDCTLRGTNVKPSFWP